MTPVLAEFIGTAVMLLLGTGVCANVSLARTKGNGAGWIVVIVTWAMAVFTGVVIAGPYSGAHLNPSVTLAFAATGQFPWSDVPGYVLAQMLGGAAGALATWLFYRPHFDLEENPDTIRGVFCTAPAVRNPASNLLSEIITLNLNNADLVLSPYYYLRQNDILYVTPNKTKAKNSDIGSSTTLWFSATSILVSIASLIVNIVR